MKEMARLIPHNNYERITDRLMWLSSSWVLKFVVDLNSYTKERGKENFHKEFGYIKNGEQAVSINRDFSYYLSIECLKKDNQGNKISIQIGMNELYFFKYKLNLVAQWFIGDESKFPFAKKDGEIFIPSSVDSIKISAAYSSYLEFIPAVIDKKDGGQSIGVVCYVNGGSTNFFMPVNIFLSFKYFIDTFNMYQSAQMLLNYVGRPESKTNYIDISAAKSPANTGFFNRVNNAKKNDE